MDVRMNPDWLAQVYVATDRLFVTRLGPEISTAAKAYCPVMGGQHSTAKASSIAAAYRDPGYSPGALRDSIRFFLKLHDLIVMATHGRSGISRWAFGSVAEKVLRQSPVPVLLGPVAGSRV